ncbi:HAAS domain-containing protein [Neobacillus niacini]|uniref:HAAS domain-containing protein n=1 Tax=Neobacillus niacini TaxID=86668 RepID=UPI002FFD842D
MVEYQLSGKSKKFIDDLKLYLFSSGKNEKETKEITEELEVHLYEAEQNGKSINQIVGASPKEYMMSISSEMKTDYRAWAKYVPLIIIGAMSFSILGDLIQGPLSYSLLKIIGTIVNSILFFGGVMIAFRYVARNQVSKIKEFLIFLLPIMISMLFIGALLLVDSIYKTPVIDFGYTGSLLIGFIFLCFIIFFSIWAKTAVLLVTIIALHLPTYILSLTTLNEEAQLISSMLATYLIMGLYLFYVVKKTKNNKEVTE